MSKLNIGTGLSLPKDTVTSTLIVYGGKGMGKTNFGAVLVEELSKAALRWSVLDPIGVWWGLRHSRDGRGPGNECLILGGTHGDFPLEPTGGAVAADLVCDEDVNVLIDFSRKPSGEMWGIGEKTRFVTDYANRLFQRQGELIGGRRREPIFQILDEAARYIPQIIPAGNPDLAKCLSAWNMLVEEGRNVGLGVGLLTQRSARMNKSVSELADAMIAFRIVGPNSIAAVMDWMGEHVPKEHIRRLIEQVRQLERGTALVVSPGWLRFEGLVSIRERETFDSSATPKPGERARRVSGKPAQPDLAKYMERMQATIERAKADDPKELRAEIRVLKQQLATAERAKPVSPSAAPNPAEVRKAIAAAVKPLETALEFTRRQASQVGKHLAQGALQYQKWIEDQIRALDRIADAAVAIPDPKPAALPTAPSPHPINRPVAVRTAPVVTLPARGGSSPADSNGQVTAKADRSILSVLVTHGGCSIEKVAVLAGYSVDGGGFRNALGRLRSNGFITPLKVDPIQITEAGTEALVSADPLPQGQALFDYWLNNDALAQAGREILQVLADASPRALTKEEIAEATPSHYEPKGGGFNNQLGRMRTLGIIRGYAPIELCEELKTALEEAAYA